MPAWLLIVAFALEPVVLDRPAAVCLYGGKFRDALREPIAATWDNAEPRGLVRRLGADRQLAILIDRRIDPTTPVSLSLTGESLATGVDRLAVSMSAAASFPDNVIYLGPPTAATWLRTTIEQHDLQLHADEAHIPERRRVELSSRYTIHWQDLDTPSDVLQQIARRHQFTINNPELVPHDLWAGATLPQVTAAEALTLVLIQFDLDWRWTDGGTAIEIVPWQPPPTLERRYKPRGKQKTADLLADWSAAFPDLTFRVDRNEVVAAGRVEDHELLQARLSGTAGRNALSEEPAPVRRRLLTLRVENVPVLAIMRELEKTGIVFVYDQTELKAAGVDLNRPVTIDVQKAPADQFFKALFDGLPLRFEIEDRRVKLNVTKG